MVIGNLGESGPKVKQHNRSKQGALKRDNFDIIIMNGSDPAMVEAIVEVTPDEVLTVAPVKIVVDKLLKDDEVSVTKQITTVYLNNESSSEDDNNHKTALDKYDIRNSGKPPYCTISLFNDIKIY